MISNISGHNSTGVRAPGSAPTRSGARLLLQTAAALSLAGYCPATAGRRGRRRRVVPFRGQGSLPAADRQQQGPQARRSVRVRASAAPAQTSVDGGASGPRRLAQRSGRPAKKGDIDQKQKLRPAGGRTGSTPAAGSGRRAGGVTLDEPGRAPERQRRSDKSAACTRETATPVYQHNFTRIKEDLGGCYRQAEEIRLQGDQAEALPIGSPRHPFTGSFNDDGHWLMVNLTRRLGDALLFDSVDHSRISLRLHNSRLETTHGSRAALIGTMKADNQLVISGLDNSWIKATGEGSVHAALVARTTGSGNRLVIEQLRESRFSAQSLPTAGSNTAMVSLGLGLIQAAGTQNISQKNIWGNHLQATALASSSGEAPARQLPESGAFAALLGFLDTKVTAQQDLVSRQETIQGDLVEALVEGRRGSGRSCASLGYASVDCGRSTPAQSWTGTLTVAQVHCVHSAARARVDWRANGTDEADRRPQDGLARATLVSTEPVSRLHLMHQSIAPGQLEAEAGVAQRALLPPTRKAHVLLLDGGDSTVPLFGHWGGPHNCSIINGPIPGDRQPGTSLVDSAGYALASFNCDSKAAAKAFLADSRQPEDWRWAQALLSDFERRLAGLPPVSDAVDNSLHYPGERVQSLITGPAAYGQWLLVTRQSYSWQPANTPPGLASTPGRLLRITRYRAPDSRQALPQSLPPSRPGFTLHPPEAGDLPLQDTVPVHSLVHHGRLFQLYQQQGQPAQLVSLSWLTNAPYRLIQYEALPGQARLLSVEGDGELHLWMQQDEHNILQVYGLGAEAPATNSSAWLHWGFDLSDQPEGRALLARAGDWLYSLRQPDKPFGSLRLPDNQLASLRRFAISTGKMDTRWQPLWHGTASGPLSLVVDRGRLMAVFLGGLPDPNAQEACHLLLARLPSWGGGPLQWSGYPAPLCQTLSVEPGAGALPAEPGSDSLPAAVSPGVPSIETAEAEEGRKAFSRVFGAALGVGALPVLMAVSACCGCACALRVCPRKKHQVVPETGAARGENGPPDRPVAFAALDDEADGPPPEAARDVEPVHQRIRL